MVFSALHSTALSSAQQQPRWDSAPAGSRHPHSQRRTQNCTAHSQAQAQPITLSPKALVRAPSEQSKVYERLEESVAKKVNLCAAAASLIITGTRRYFALSASLGPRSPRFENAGLRRNGGWKLVQRGDRRRGYSTRCGKVRGRYRSRMRDIVARRTFEAGACSYVKAAYDGDARDRRTR